MIFTKIIFRPWGNRWLETSPQWHPLCCWKVLLQKLTVRYEDYLEKISMSLQSIGNLKMLPSSDFHVSESSLSKVIPEAAQSLTVQSRKSPQNYFLWLTSTCKTREINLALLLAESSKFFESNSLVAILKILSLPNIIANRKLLQKLFLAAYITHFSKNQNKTGNMRKNSLNSV
jgi:hypothetical protein